VVLRSSAHADRSERAPRRSICNAERTELPHDRTLADRQASLRSHAIIELDGWIGPRPNVTTESQSAASTGSRQNVM